MLCLSRKKNEQVVLGIGSLTAVVTVVEIRGDKVRLGFIAPAEVTVHRREIWDAIASAKARRAASADSPDLSSAPAAAPAAPASP